MYFDMNYRFWIAEGGVPHHIGLQRHFGSFAHPPLTKQQFENEIIHGNYPEK